MLWWRLVSSSSTWFPGSIASGQCSMEDSRGERCLMLKDEELEGWINSRLGLSWWLQLSSGRTKLITGGYLPHRPLSSTAYFSHPDLLLIHNQEWYWNASHLTRPRILRVGHQSGSFAMCTWGKGGLADNAGITHSFGDWLRERTCCCIGRPSYYKYLPYARLHCLDAGVTSPVRGTAM